MMIKEKKRGVCTRNKIREKKNNNNDLYLTARKTEVCIYIYI